MDRFVQRSRPAGQSRAPLSVASSNLARRDTDERPVKKRKVTPQQEIRDSDAESDDGENSGLAAEQSRLTEFESALPSIDVGKDAIEEYETLRASQLEADGLDPSKPEKGRWVRGRSSIYVDAFTLALDTVLEDETHLFDDKERRVFEQWRALDYEAQYLYLLYAFVPCNAWIRADGSTAMCAYFSGKQHPGTASSGWDITAIYPTSTGLSSNCYKCASCRTRRVRSPLATWMELRWRTSHWATPSHLQMPQKTT